MPESTRLHDYSRSRAVLIGTWKYDWLPSIAAAGNSLRRMEGLLTGPLCDWPKDRLLVLPNQPGPGDLADQLITAFESVTDIALFYYVGHGQIGADNQLCLGLTGSRTEYNRRGATSLLFEAVRRSLLDCPATTKIVILDCCFAGLASQPGNTLAAPGTGDLAAETLADSANCPGAYIMCASGPFTKAWYDTDPNATLPQTYFTGYLADLVEAGISGEPEVLRLDPLFLRLKENLLRDHRPEPVARKIDDARHFAFARNAALPADHHDGPARHHPERLTRRPPRPTPRTPEHRRHTAIFLAIPVLLAALAFGVYRVAHLPDSTHPGPPSLSASSPGHLATRPPGDPTTSPASGPAQQQYLAAAGAPRVRSTRNGGNIVVGVAVSTAHGIVAAAFNFQNVAIWRLPALGTPDVVNDDGTSDVGTEVVIYSAAFSPDGTTLAAGSADGTIYLVNPVSGQHTFTLHDPPDPSAGTTGHEVVSLAFSANGQTLAVGDSDGIIYLWDLSTRQHTGIVFRDPGGNGINSLALAPNSKIMAEADDHSSSIYLWNISTGQELRPLPYPGSNPDGIIDSVAFSPDSSTLAAGTYDGSLYLWHLPAGHAVTLQGPTNLAVKSLAFSPDGGTLAVGRNGELLGGVILWDVSTRRASAPLSGQTGEIDTVAFSPDSKFLAAGDANGVTYLWPLR